MPPLLLLQLLSLLMLPLLLALFTRWCAALTKCQLLTELQMRALRCCSSATLLHLQLIDADITHNRSNNQLAIGMSPTPLLVLLKLLPPLEATQDLLVPSLSALGLAVGSVLLLLAVLWPLLD